MSVNLFQKESVSPRLLLIDGLPRTGKMLMTKLISNFHRVEYFQYLEVVEHLGILWRLGLIDDPLVRAFLRLQLDLAIYNRAVGRNLNLRRDDSSSLHLAPDSHFGEPIQPLAVLVIGETDHRFGMSVFVELRAFNAIRKPKPCVFED